MEENVFTGKTVDEAIEQGLKALGITLDEAEINVLEEGKKKEDWYDMIQLLPSSYNQMRTCSLNYETLINIYYARKDHKLQEWHSFCDWIASLPYGKELIIAE